MAENARNECLYSGDLAAADAYTTITKWTECWRASLVGLGAFGMDITNHSEDRLRTHVVYIEVEFRTPRPPDRARWLRLMSAQIAHRKTVIAKLAAFNVPPATLALLDEPPPTGDTAPKFLHVAIACMAYHGQICTFKWQVQDDDEIWKGPLSKVRAETWHLKLQEMIESGEPW